MTLGDLAAQAVDREAADPALASRCAESIEAPKVEPATDGVGGGREFPGCLGHADMFSGCLGHAGIFDPSGQKVKHPWESHLSTRWQGCA